MPFAFPKSASNRTKAGKSFESEIKQTCEAYLSHETAYIWQNGTRCIHNGKLWIPILSSVDFIGLLVNGRMVAIECKVHNTNKLPIVQKSGNQAGLQQHQIAELQTIGAFGGLAFVLWKNKGAVRLFNYNEFSHRDKCLFWEQGHEVKQGMGFIFNDFLETIKLLGD